MKIPHTQIKRLLFTLVLLINSVLVCFGNDLNSKIDSSKAKTISFKIKLKSDHKVTIKPSPLKFNKHFAYSFTLDDGYRSAYLTAFPLLNGGKISKPNKNEWKIDQGGDGTTSKGLFIQTDSGIKFRLNSLWPSMADQFVICPKTADIFLGQKLKKCITPVGIF